MSLQVGVHGIGVGLPEQVRRNDWWPAEVVEDWRSRINAPRADGRDPKEIIARMSSSTVDASARRVMAAIARERDDPFDGVVERRVLAENERFTDIAIVAAKEAIARAGIAADEVDLMLMSAFVQPMAQPLVHGGLGLSERCLSFSTHDVCNDFLHQLSLAQPFIASKRARFALLIQMSGGVAALDPTSMLSVRFGEGATAVVLGPVKDGLGLLSRNFLTDGTSYGGFGSSVVDGKVRVTHQNPTVHARLILSLPGHAKRMIESALAEAKLSKSDVGFWASHRASSWMQREIGAHCGFEQVEQTSTYPWTGNLFGANVPLSLAMAERDGTLTPGTVVAIFTLAAGATAAAAILRWGTA